MMGGQSQLPSPWSRTPWCVDSPKSPQRFPGSWSSPHPVPFQSGKMTTEWKPWWHEVMPTSTGINLIHVRIDSWQGVFRSLFQLKKMLICADIIGVTQNMTYTTVPWLTFSPTRHISMSAAWSCSIMLTWLWADKCLDACARQDNWVNRPGAQVVSARVPNDPNTTGLAWTCTPLWNIRIAWKKQQKLQPFTFLTHTLLTTSQGQDFPAARRTSWQSLSARGAFKRCKTQSKNWLLKSHYNG